MASNRPRAPGTRGSLLPSSPDLGRKDKGKPHVGVGSLASSFTRHGPGRGPAEVSELMDRPAIIH